jgi:hypothetical protein
MGCGARYGLFFCDTKGAPLAAPPAAPSAAPGPDLSYLAAPALEQFGFFARALPLLPGPSRGGHTPVALSTVNRFCVALLCGRAVRITAKKRRLPAPGSEASCDAELAAHVRAYAAFLVACAADGAVKPALLAGCRGSRGRCSPLDKGTAPPAGHAGMLRRSGDSQATPQPSLGPWEARLVDKRRFRLAERTAAFC